MIDIELYEDQQAQVAPLLAKARAAAERGEPGIIFAQVFTDEIRVLFVEHKYATQIQAVFARRGEAIRAAAAEAA